MAELREQQEFEEEQRDNRYSHCARQYLKRLRMRMDHSPLRQF